MARYFPNKKISWCLTGCMLLILAACSPSKEDKKKGDVTEQEIRSLSETMGFLLYENLQAQNLKMDIDSLIRGLENAKTGGTPPLTTQEYANLLMKYRESVLKIQGSENLKIAQDFLSENKGAEGVISLNDGKLQYVVVKRGDGATVTENDTPLIEYEGKLVDGKVFDSTKQRGQPLALPLKGTIPGFKMGVMGMKEGEKRKIFIHPELGYGSKGRLPPNSLLIFEVELLKAKDENSVDKHETSYEDETDEDTPSHEDDTGYQWLKKIKQIFF